MDTCVIFCAGEFDGLVQPLDDTCRIIAADGGLKHLDALGRKPDIVLGDFDSLGYTPRGADVFPVEKDDTDAMLAVRRGLALGFRRFVLYGSLDGPRLDHTVANLQTLLFLAEHHAAGFLVGTRYIAAAVKNGTLFFPPSASGILSVFCLGSDASGVTLTGLKYPLTDAVLTAGFPLGVSNHFTGAPAAVTVKRGCLITLYDKSNGLPQTESEI